MLKKYWPFILLAFLVILFWYPVTQNNDFFYDDLGFIETFQQNKTTLGYFFAPHNEHFMPMFKAIFFVMFKLFSLNIVPYMWLLILVHIINVCLFFYLCRLIFPHAKWLPLILAILVLSNSTYYEVIHWFTLLCTALSFMFLQVSLVFLHLYVEHRERKLLLISAISSFFIPMNFSLGIIGIAFIFLYYFCIINKGFRFKEIKEYFKLLWPWGLAWISYLIVYFIFSHSSGFKAGRGLFAFNLSNAFSNVLSGFGGFFIKSLGIGLLMQPLNIWVAGFLIFNLIGLAFFLILYFSLNPRKERGRVLHDRGIALYSFLGAFISYLVIAVARTDLSSGVFLNWGRYQFFSVFFLTIFIGNMLPSLITLFSKIFNKKRFKIYLTILFILFLVGQFVVIRAKAHSPIRTEGNLFEGTSLLGYQGEGIRQAGKSDNQVA